MLNGSSDVSGLACTSRDLQELKGRGLRRTGCVRAVGGTDPRHRLAATAVSMITEEKHPLRVLFFRDHEIRGHGRQGWRGCGADRARKHRHPSSSISVGVLGTAQVPTMMAGRAARRLAP